MESVEHLSSNISGNDLTADVVQLTVAHQGQVLNELVTSVSVSCGKPTETLDN